MKKIGFRIIILILFLLVFNYILIINNDKNNIKKYFEKEATSNITSIVNNQYDINKKLNSIVDDDNYTISNPYIELNPYKISPLSAIIIFNTSVDQEVELFINNKSVTKMESTKKHVIPVYGLKEDYDNKIKLITNDKTYEYTIKTEKSKNNYLLNIKKSYETDDIYFTVASYETYLTGWDYEGNLRFYLTTDNRMDVEWLGNNHFLIGVSDGQFAENFIGFVEMDYLGKIYNYYTLENGYSFETQLLSNGNIMSAGGTTPVYIKEQVVYEIDPTSGKKVSEINISKIVKEIDPDFDDKYIGQKAIRNAFYYNEETKELLLSFRGWDAILSVNYVTKELNYIFTDPYNELFKSSVWDKYKVSLESGRYPLGQHSVVITKDGHIAFFNNGYNRYHGFENGGEDKVSAYKDNYSSGETYKIDNKKAYLVWSFDANKQLFSHQYGSINMDSDNNKLVNFGYVLKTSYRQNKNATLSNAEAGVDNIYAKIYEVDKNDNVIFEATSEEGKFRAFKHKLYADKTKNMDVSKLNIFNTIPDTELEENTYKKLSITDSIEWIYDANLTTNTFTTNYKLQDADKLYIYLLNEKGKVYSFDYTENKIFNINIPKGKYALFINLNNTIYNTNKVYKF